MSKLFNAHTNVVYATNGGNYVNFVSNSRSAVRTLKALEEPFFNFWLYYFGVIGIFEIFVQVRFDVVGMHPVARLDIASCSADNLTVLDYRFALLDVAKGKLVSLILIIKSVVRKSNRGIYHIRCKLCFTFLDANTFLGEGVTGKAPQVLVNATMAYGAAIQTMDKKDENGNVISSGDIGILNAFNKLWKDEAADVDVIDTIATAPEYSGEADYLTDAEGNYILDADQNKIPIAKITGANVAMSKTYALLYKFTVNLPSGAELKEAFVILTDTEDALNDRTQPWDGTVGTRYNIKETGTEDNGSTYHVAWVENVPASEMAVRYATIYVKYTTVGENGETVEHHAYSQTVKYGVVTYLNGQIYEMTKNGVPTEDADLKQLYLLSNLRTVAMFAEKDKNQ